MADRVVWRSADEDEIVALRVFRGRGRAAGLDLLASVVVPVDDGPRSSAPSRGSKPRCATCCRSPRAHSNAGRCPSCAGIPMPCSRTRPAGDGPRSRSCGCARGRPSTASTGPAWRPRQRGRGLAGLARGRRDRRGVDVGESLRRVCGGAPAEYLGPPPPGPLPRGASLPTESEAADARAPAAPRSPLWRLFAYARPYTWPIAAALLLASVGSAGSYGRAYLIKPLFDDVIAPAQALREAGKSLPLDFGNLVPGRAPKRRHRQTHRLTRTRCASGSRSRSATACSRSSPRSC